ncbi:hypothetical protein [Wolbachia endosymbiont (group A) of Yponomeuta plumbellus]|uniref:hypothetical protein n=1 Tax=Wolbachia endosymbiont (group A) of Yponomeuta plumbellus TaxID=2954068 RepID=UPI00222E3D31|nr:hypothetical protein [Wolbachia endosymbiont (group A) of Yponomeuta plumbellus]
MTSLDFVKELVNAFNVSNYGSKVNTNFVVEGDNIIVKFNCGRRSAKRYLSQMARDLVREYYSDEFVACHVFDLESFPFHFDKKWLKYDKKTRITKLTVPIDSRVIFNLKVHFAEEFENDVEDRVIKKIDEKHHLGKKRIEETLNASIKQAKMDPSSSYIKCLLFNGPNLQTYFVMALQAQMEEHGCSYSDFYHIDGNKVYVKDVENIGFIRNITEASKKEVGYNFYLQHSDNLKVKAKHYKDAIGELIFRLTEISIHRYYYDEFIDKDKISNGDRFAFIPTIKEGNISRYLNRGEANKINAQFGYDLLTDIKGQTETTRSGRFGGVYAFSNRQIALLIPVIIENSVINKDGQIEIDPGLPRTLLAEASPTQKFPKRSCGEGLEKHPRQGSEREKETEPFRGVLGEEIGQASTSSQQTDMPSSSYAYIDKRDESMPEDSYFLPSTLTSFPRVITPPVHYTISTKPILLTTKNDQKSSSLEFSARSPCLKDVNILGMKSEEHDKSEQGACSQVGVRALEGDQADDESMLIKIQGQQVSYRPSLTPFPTAWNDSMSLNSVASNEEPEKQQVTDESDRKSSDEYSEAKSQDSKSPKKHGGGVQKIKKFFFSHFKKQHDVNLKRHDEGRDSVCSISSSVSAPGGSVSKKPPISKRLSLPNRVRAENNSLSKETSPVSSLDGDPGPSQGTISGKGEVLPVEYRSDNSSSKKVDRDSGFCSMGSPDVQHKGSVSSELKHPQQVKHTSEALGKEI